MRGITNFDNVLYILKAYLYQRKPLNKSSGFVNVVKDVICSQVAYGQNGWQLFFRCGGFESIRESGFGFFPFSWRHDHFICLAFYIYLLN